MSSTILINNVEAAEYHIVAVANLFQLQVGIDFSEVILVAVYSCTELRVSELFRSNRGWAYLWRVAPHGLSYYHGSINHLMMIYVALATVLQNRRWAA